MNSEKSWLLTYSNLMTIFLVFFMLLYVFSHYADEEQFESVINVLQAEVGGTPDTRRLDKLGIRREEENMAHLLNVFIEDSGIRRFAEVKVDKADIRVVFAEPLAFDSGRAEVKPSALPFLEKLAGIIRNIPNQVVIEGHTDNVPLSSASPYSSNWELSLERAFSIIHYFTIVETIAGRRFIPVGFGEYRPVAPNDTPENREKNRRIEIRIKRSEV